MMFRLEFTATLPQAVPSVDLWVVPFWAALGVAEGIEAATGIRVQLEWPNAILIEGCRCGEITCVARIDGERSWASLDIALEVAAEESRRQHTLDAILAAFEARNVLLADASAVARAWEARAQLAGTQYHIAIEGTEPFHARALMLAQEGSLVVQSGDEIRVVHLADARVQRADPVPPAVEADVDSEASSDFIELDYDEAVAALSPEEREALELLEHLANLEEGEQR